MNIYDIEQMLEQGEGIKIDFTVVPESESKAETSKAVTDYKKMRKEIENAFRSLLPQGGDALPSNSSTMAAKRNKAILNDVLLTGTPGTEPDKGFRAALDLKLTGETLNQPPKLAIDLSTERDYTACAYRYAESYWTEISKPTDLYKNPENYINDNRPLSVREQQYADKIAKQAELEVIKHTPPTIQPFTHAAMTLPEIGARYVAIEELE